MNIEKLRDFGANVDEGLQRNIRKTSFPKGNYPRLTI